ncbi:TolC family outer membrane protein [Vibrio mangrovi]|uniref:Outer membrane efflux protein BepC n=1 Tax=Vibrio mangrovi TaxID=474394 RepID=A0A1Y6ISC5_9VIBR|nr:TolC family outer membrane protein [Vibrio mangrovi]MDW6004228.1 TolC family outer membrane protein [Vibrio mangrovi]SMR98973.1 Outer membrane efflux protein BepC precursor [Vibrio mangrovi]
MKTFPLKAVACFCILLNGNVLAQSLEQAVSITLATNPELESAFNQYQSQLHNAEASQGAYLPKIDLDAGIGYEGIAPATSNAKEDTDLTRKEATISLTQLIWDGSATINDIGRTAADAESNRYQLLADASDKALEVAKIYLDAEQADEVLKLSEANLKIHKKIYRDIKRRTESGLGSTADVTQVEARVAKAEANLLAAQNNLFEAHSKFKQTVGEAPSNLTFPQADQDLLPHSFQDAKDQAFKTHPVLKVAQEDIVAARYQYKQSQSPYYPSVSLEANHSIRSDAAGYLGSSSETTAMLRLHYNLYNGGTDRANEKSAAYSLNRAKDLREKSYREVVGGLELAWQSLDLSTQRRTFLADLVDSVSKTVIAYEKQYQIGQRTLLDLLNSENELFEARKDYLDAKYTEVYARYRVMNAVGNLLDGLKVIVPKEWTEPSGD